MTAAADARTAGAADGARAAALDPGYWAGAEAAGLAVHHGGRRLVVGSSTHGLTGETGLLVEYADPPAFTDGTLEAVLAARIAAHPATARVEVRTPAGTFLPAPWRRSVTYVRRSGPPAAPVLPAGLRIVPAGEEHRAPVHAWMARAVREGAADQGLHGAEDAVAAAVGEVLADPSRSGWVALLDGAAVGHAVLLGGQADEVTGAVRAELWDVLVEPDTPHAGVCRDALVAAAAGHAHRLGLPLLGHVVHHAGEGESRVLASLLAKGWHTDHAYWSAAPAELSGLLPAPAPPAAPAAEPPAPRPVRTPGGLPATTSIGTPR